MARADRRQARRIRQVRASQDPLRSLHGSRGHPGVPRHRGEQGAEPAARAVEAPRRARHLHPAPRHRGQMGLLRGRGARRRRAQSGEAPLRGDLFRRRRPRHHRGVARRRLQAPRVRMAEGLAVLDPGERDAPHRQCELEPGAAARRHHRAEPDEPHQQCRRDLRLPLPVPRPLQRRRRLLQVQGRHRAGPGARARHAAHQLHPRHRQLRPAARQPPLAGLAAASSRS